MSKKSKRSREAMSIGDKAAMKGKSADPNSRISNSRTKRSKVPMAAAGICVILATIFMCISQFN